MSDNKTFGQWVKETMERKGLIAATCGRRANMPHSHWHNIMEDEPKRRNGTLPNRRSETCQKVAVGLDEPLDSVRAWAGLRPLSDDSVSTPATEQHSENSEKPTISKGPSLSEIRKALERLINDATKIEQMIQAIS